ncbi:MAG: aspartate kinase [bacterium]
MSLIVMKFGGTSLATPELVLQAAKKVAYASKKNDIVVVVSAMGKTTDKLFSMSKKINIKPKDRETDMLLTAGERISVALLSMALGQLDLEAASYTGSQVGIITDNKHTDARILQIKGDRIKKALAEKKIPVVCGFQGVSQEKEITTLGRGGSDTTALALSAVLKAEKCLIYTDVDGVYAEDPKLFPGAKKIDRLCYNEMLELSSRGAQVLHPRASCLAAKYKIPVEVRNSLNNKSGTLITDLEGIEKPKPRAITHSKSLYLVTLTQVPRKSHYVSQLVTELTNGGVNLKFFFHGVSYARKFDLSFITALTERDQVKMILGSLVKRIGVYHVEESTDICSLSIIGRGIGSDHTILSATFNTLAKTKIHIELITTSELSINIFMKKQALNKAIRALLDRFHLRKVMRKRQKNNRQRK